MKRSPADTPCRYVFEVYMDDFIDLAIPTCQQDLDHLASATMTGIHDVFPAAPTPAEDPISSRKLGKGDGAWANVKDILGMTFDGTDKTIWLSEEKRDALLVTLKTWMRKASKRCGIAFDEFRTTLSKLQHAFLTVPAGKGLLSAFYVILRLQPPIVYLHTNTNLRNAVADCRTFLRETVSSPTKCRNLVTGWPDFIGITDASGHGLGGVIIGEQRKVPPIVFRLQWPQDISDNIVSDANPNGEITNSDLEMAGLLMLWLVMEEVCEVKNAHVALFSDNSPTVHWVQRLAAKHSHVAMQLIRALALRLHLAQASPLTPMHIAGVNNSLTDIPSRSFGSDAAWYCKTDTQLLTLFNKTFPLPNQASWTVFRPSSKLAMRVISILRMRAFTADEWRRLPKKRRTHWKRWVAYVLPLGVDPHLYETPYNIRVRALSGFAAHVRSGIYGRKKQVRAGTVNSALTAIGTTISLARGINPTKVDHTNNLLPRLAQMLEGWRKSDPPTVKKLPVAIDIPELLAEVGRDPAANELDKAIGDLVLIAFYYLLRVGEYTIKGHRNNTKQTVQFRLQDVTFFKRDRTGRLRQLSRHADDQAILSADSATLKLDNQKNGWKGVCVHQEHNGDPYSCPVRALGRRFVHIRSNTFDNGTFLSAFFVQSVRFDVTDNDIRGSLKQAAVALHYPEFKGIPIARIDTHSLRSGGANALSLAGYSDREIQKMGRWRSATFKEYIREELACFSTGMSKSMKRHFQFVNIAGGVYTDVTDQVIPLPYNSIIAASA